MPHSASFHQPSLFAKYSKTCLKRPLTKIPKVGFQDFLLLNAGQKYCRMHSAILLTCIKLPHGFKTFVPSIFEWPLDRFHCNLFKSFQYIGLNSLFVVQAMKSV